MAEDDRDKRKLHTPPPGVLKQIAPSNEPETWEENRARLTPIQPTPIPGSVQISRTFTPENVLSDLDRRSKETKNTGIDTLRMLENHRRETREDLAHVHERLNSTNEKVDAMITVVGDVRTEVGRQGGQNTMIIDMLKGMQHERTTLRVAEIEVDKTRQISEIQDATDAKLAARKIRTKFWLKVIGIGGVAAATIIALVKAYLL